MGHASRPRVLISPDTGLSVKFPYPSTTNETPLLVDTSYRRSTLDTHDHVGALRDFHRADSY